MPAALAERIAPCCPPAHCRDAGRAAAARPAMLTNPSALPRSAELRHQLRLLPRRRRAVHPAGHAPITGPATARPRVRLWLRLFDADGAVLATWEQPLPPGPGGFAIDSAEVRAPLRPARVHRPAVPPRHRCRRPRRGEIRARHLWPAATAPACPAPMMPMPGRPTATPACRRRGRTNAWSSGCRTATPPPIPAGAIALDRMGAERRWPWTGRSPPYASVALDVADLLPGLHWPAQIEVRAGRHVVRPRYEVVRGGPHPHRPCECRARRPAARSGHHDRCPPRSAAAILLPFPVLPPEPFPHHPAADADGARPRRTLPVRLDVFDRDGTQVAEHFLGCLPRDHDLALDVDDVRPTRAMPNWSTISATGGEADGWLHALFRYEDRATATPRKPASARISSTR